MPTAILAAPLIYSLYSPLVVNFVATTTVCDTNGNDINFLSRVIRLTRNIDIAILSVCLSVRPLRSDIVRKQLNVLS